MNLNRGALKGVDAHLVSNLRQIAQEEGIAVCLASLELTITGEADDCGGGYYKRNRRSGWGRGYSSSEDEDDDVPGMAEETDRTLTVNHVVDLDGIPIMGDRSLNIEEEHIIPENSFENAEPDDSQYEGYMGNVCLRNVDRNLELTDWIVLGCRITRTLCVRLFVSASPR